MYGTATKDPQLKDIKNTASNIRDEAIDTANDVSRDLSTAANQAGRKVRNFLSHASDEIYHVKDSAVKEIRTNPVQSSLIALGAGFILGALFRR